MSKLLANLQKFIDGEGDVFAVFPSDISDPNDATDVAELKARLSVLDARKFRVETAPEGTVYVYRIKGAQGTVFAGEPDARQGEDPPYSPFRTRYRKLSEAEVQYHDGIKATAEALLGYIDGIPNVRSDKGPLGGQIVNRDLALARTHLEDAVMRAVRALTA